MPAHKIALEIRFWQKVDKSDDCWLWTGARHPLGYGHIKIDGKVEGAHRVSYEMANGPIPLGMALDHLCCVPACVNPEHLEVVTISENTRRGSSQIGSRRTHCRRGHTLTPETTYHWQGIRICRTCRSAYVRAR